MNFSWSLSLNKLRWFRLALLLPSLTVSKSGKILSGLEPEHVRAASGGLRCSAHTAKYCCRMILAAKQGDPMLYTVAVVLVILWALGLVTAYTMGGFIHVLLVIAVVVVLLRVIGGRSPL
jgi:hypothetical protein